MYQGSRILFTHFNYEKDDSEQCTTNHRKKKEGTNVPRIRFYLLTFIIHDLRLPNCRYECAGFIRFNIRNRICNFHLLNRNHFIDHDENVTTIKIMRMFNSNFKILTEFFAEPVVQFRTIKFHCCLSKYSRPNTQTVFSLE